MKRVLTTVTVCHITVTGRKEKIRRIIVRSVYTEKIRITYNNI